jgi:ribosome-associated protein
MLDLRKEIKFNTARSGGKGGQNVNKVETMVEAYFHIEKSLLLTDNQKTLISYKLKNQINAEGFLIVKSQSHRTQLENKQEVIMKLHQKIKLALKVDAKRIATKPSKASNEKRVEEKKKRSNIKLGRTKIKSAE